MPCCGQAPNGMVNVWHLRQAGKDPQEFSNQAEAEAAKTRQGGGIVLKVTKRVDQK